MGIGTRMFRLGAVLPGIVLSAALTLVVSAALASTLGGMLLVAYLVAALVLAFGQFEAPAVQALGRARRSTAGQEQLLSRCSAAKPDPGSQHGRIRRRRLNGRHGTLAAWLREVFAFNYGIYHVHLAESGRNALRP